MNKYSSKSLEIHLFWFHCW